MRSEIDKLKRDAVPKADFDQLKKDAVPKADFDRLKQDAQLKKDAVLKADFDRLKQDAQLKKDAVLKADFDRLKQDAQLKKDAVLKADLDVQFKQQNEALKGEVDQLKKYAVAKTDFDKLKEEVQFKKGAVPKSEFDKLKRDVVSKTQLTEKVCELREEHKVALHKLHHHIHIAPVQIAMSNFEQHKRDIWRSDPFYTHPHGYTMYLRVDANGSGDGKGTHVSVFVCIARGGEFDNHLKWPFQGRITIWLLNQLDNRNHYEQIIPFTQEMDMHRVTHRNRSRDEHGRGYSQFIAHTELNQSDNCQYFKNDCLMFLVEAQA